MKKFCLIPSFPFLEYTALLNDLPKPSIKGSNKNLCIFSFFFLEECQAIGEYIVNEMISQNQSYLIPENSPNCNQLSSPDIPVPMCYIMCYIMCCILSCALGDMEAPSTYGKISSFISELCCPYFDARQFFFRIAPYASEGK